MATENDSALVADLIPYLNNARTHSDEQINQVAASIKEFGFLNPILIDQDNQIVAGHCRLSAAKKLGLESVPIRRIDHLTQAQIKAYVLADNQLALNAGWDLDLLKLELEHLKEIDFDIDLIGFDEMMLDTLLEQVNFDAGSEADQGQLDELSPQYVCCPKCGKEFDVRENRT